jgi:hypothetical protein
MGSNFQCGARVARAGWKHFNFKLFIFAQRKS